MLLWIACALLTAAVLAALLRPLWRVTDTTTIEPGAADLAVYRDQLTEVEADQARGLIDAQEAETARREVSRRLLAHSDRVAAAAANPVHRDSRVPALGLVVAALVPASTLALYLTIGSPGLWTAFSCSRAPIRVRPGRCAKSWIWGRSRATSRNTSA